MLVRICLGLSLLAATAAWSQASPETTQDAGSASDNSSQMQTPPPASGEAYPTEVRSEARSNFLSGGLVFVTAYVDNVLPGETSKPVSDMTYSIRPTVTLNQSTYRETRMITYSPGFTFYQPTSELNEADQNVTANYKYRLTPHLTVDANEGFSRSSNVFNQTNSSLGGPITGSPQPTAVIVPFAGQLSNATNGDLTYQLSANGMIGGTGSYTKQSYTSSSATSGLSDSNSSGGAFSYSCRMSLSQYIGVKYQYLRSLTDSKTLQSETQGQIVAPFWTVYFRPTFSISLSAGPQHISASQSTPSARAAFWAPTATASIGWQGMRTSLAGSYSRIVSDVGGLQGAFTTTSASAAARWQISRMWSVSSNANYAIQKDASPGIVSSAPGGGHSISGSASIDHSITEHLKLDVSYVRLHQSYEGIAGVSNAPDVDRTSVSISYQFTRPLGR